MFWLFKSYLLNKITGTNCHLVFVLHQNKPEINMGIWECDIKVKVRMGIDLVKTAKRGFEWWVVNSNNDVNTQYTQYRSFLWELVSSSYQDSFHAPCNCSFLDFFPWTIYGILVWYFPPKFWEFDTCLIKQFDTCWRCWSVLANWNY